MKVGCVIKGHRYALAEVPEGAVFYRLDCVRCEGAPIDGALLRDLVGKNPALVNYLGRSLGRRIDG